MTKITQLMPELLILREMASRPRALTDDAWRIDAAYDAICEAYAQGYADAKELAAKVVEQFDNDTDTVDLPYMGVKAAAAIRAMTPERS